MKTLLTNSKILIASALMMGVALSPMTVNAFAVDSANGEYQQNKKGNKKGNKEFRKMAKHLQLTEAQRTEIKAIREAMKTENQAQKVQMQSFQAELKELIASNNFTDDNFAALYDKYEESIEQKALNQAKTKNAIFQVLTDEQKVQWQAFSGKRKGKSGK